MDANIGLRLDVHAPVFCKDASNVITLLRQLRKSPGCCGNVRLHTRIIGNRKNSGARVVYFSWCHGMNNVRRC